MKVINNRCITSGFKDNIPEEDAKELIDRLMEESEEEEKDTKDSEPEVSRLNPESEIISEKDPDEV